jgi:hypothetical protein
VAELEGNQNLQTPDVALLVRRESINTCKSVKGAGICDFQEQHSTTIKYSDDLRPNPRTSFSTLSAGHSAQVQVQGPTAEPRPAPRPRESPQLVGPARWGAQPRAASPPQPRSRPSLPARAARSPPPSPAPSPAAARSALPQLADRFPVAFRASVRMGADQLSAGVRVLAALRNSPGLGSWLRSTISNSSPGSGPGPGANSGSRPAGPPSSRSAMLAASRERRAGGRGLGAGGPSCALAAPGCPRAGFLLLAALPAVVRVNEAGESRPAAEGTPASHRPRALFARTLLLSLNLLLPRLKRGLRGAGSLSPFSS